VWSNDGSQLQNLNASNITSGTLNDARLSSNVPLKNAANVFTNTNTFTTVNGNIFNGNFFNGGLFTGTFSGSFSGDGSGLTNLNASAISHGTLGTYLGGKRYGAAFDWIRAFNGGTNLFRVRSDWAGSMWTSTDILTDSLLVTASSRFTGPVRIQNSLIANTLAGDGAGLTNLNASNITTGTLNDARLSPNVPLKNAANVFTNTNTFTTVNGTQFNGGTFTGSAFNGGTFSGSTFSGTTFNGTNFNGGTFTGTHVGTHVGDGSGLTNLNASNITSGTLNDARLSSNVALKNAANVFTQLNTFNNGIAVNRNGAPPVDVFSDFNGTSGEMAKFRWTDAGFGTIGTYLGGKRYGAAFDWIRAFNGGSDLFRVRSEWTGSMWTATDIRTDSLLVTAASRFIGPVFVSSLSGDGSGLTNLNASNISTGTLNDARLSSNVPLKNGNNVFTGINSFGTVNGTTFNGGTFNGTFLGTHIGDGSGLTNLNADNIATGTLDLARIDASTASPGQAITFDGANVVWGSGPGGASSLVLPFDQTANEPGRMFTLTNTNNIGGAVARFENNNSTNTGKVLHVETDGTGEAMEVRSTNLFNPTHALEVFSQGTISSSALRVDQDGLGVGAYMEIGNPASVNNTLVVQNFGLGRGALIQSTNSLNTSDILSVYTAGTGNTIRSEQAGTSGSAGEFYNSNAANSDYAVAVTSAGGHGIKITSNASGNGVAINMTRGAFIGSYTAINSGAAIPADYMVVHINADATGAPATATLPAGTNGQVIVLSTNDANGLLVGGTFTPSTNSRRYTYINGAWKVEF
jgi:hypothetical protein